MQKNFKVHNPLIYFVCLFLLLFSILAYLSPLSDKLPHL
nr:MAG TPA: hypothetical protein [Caudoviricetes sp.]